MQMPFRRLTGGTPRDAAGAVAIVAEVRSVSVRADEAAGNPGRATPHLASQRVRLFADLVVFLDAESGRAAEREERLDEVAGAEYRSDAMTFTGTPAELTDLVVEADRALVADRVDSQFVGAAKQAAGALEQLRDATGADELIITTITHDHADRVRSYELLADERSRR